MNETSWKIVDYAWALVGGLIMIIWHMLNNKIQTNHKVLNDKVETQEATLNDKVHELRKESDAQRANISKLFDKLEEHSNASISRHLELLTALHNDRKDH